MRSGAAPCPIRQVAVGVHRLTDGAGRDIRRNVAKGSGRTLELFERPRAGQRLDR
jgi:hypothetical protein